MTFWKIAMSIVADGSRRVSRRTVRALLGAALFEGSDRARIVVYGALDQLESRRRGQVREALKEIVDAREQYGHVVNATSFDEW